MAKQFETLSLHAYESNCEIGARFNAPSFASTSAATPENLEVFASNVVVTFDGFHNAPHCDHDATQFAFGLFGTINRASGLLSRASANGTHGKVLGSHFFLDDYNLFINYDLCDGVVEQVWNTQVRHHTPAPRFLDSFGRLIYPTESFITRFGCSAQISLWLVKRLVSMSRLRGERSDEEWKDCLKTLVTGYYHDFDKKMGKLIGKK